MLKNAYRTLACFAILLAIGLVACAPQVPNEVVVTREVVVTVEAPPLVVTSPPETEVVVVTATPTTEPEAAPISKDLVICGREPHNLYFYGEDTASSSSGDVFDAIYTNDFTQLSFGYQAEGLEKLPSLADNDAVVHEVAVSSGDRVVDATGEVVALADGMSLINADGETIIFDGESVTMSQLVVDFTMKQRFWSDGTPVTADDSVYSFGLAADPVTTVAKFVIERTASYEATDTLSTRWTGLPGYLDSTYFTNFWPPMPQHAWSQYSPTDLLEVVDATRRPIGDGAFMIDEWIDGEYIRLLPNPFYYRADEGIPYLDSVTFRFIEENQLLAQLIAGDCDIASTSSNIISQMPFLLEAEASGLLEIQAGIGTVFEHIDFGINSYGDYGDGIGRPDWFEDVRVRQAITMCTDRQRMVDQILFGRSEVIHTYIPTIHPLYPDGLTEWPFDVERANALLDEVGFVDNNGDGWREDPASGTPFQVTIGTVNNHDVRRQVTEIFQENMLACGIDVVLLYLPRRELFASGAEGVIFGRQFDLGLFAWITSPEPPCSLWLSQRIPGPIEEGFGGWGEPNNTGWQNEAFDEACILATSSLPGTADYEAGHKEASRIFAQEMPIIPLFSIVQIALARPNVLNLTIDPTDSPFFNIYELDLEQ